MEQNQLQRKYTQLTCGRSSYCVYSCKLCPEDPECNNQKSVSRILISIEDQLMIFMFYLENGRIVACNMMDILGTRYISSYEKASHN